MPPSSPAFSIHAAVAVREDEADRRIAEAVAREQQVRGTQLTRLHIVFSKHVLSRHASSTCVALGCGTPKCHTVPAHAHQALQPPMRLRSAHAMKPLRGSGAAERRHKLTVNPYSAALQPRAIRL